MQNGCTGWAGTQGKQKRISTRNLNIALCFKFTGRWAQRMQNGCTGWVGSRLAPDFSSDGHVSPAILVCDTSSALQLGANATVRSTSAASNVPMQMILSEAGSQSPTTRRLYTPIDVTRDLWSWQFKIRISSALDKLLHLQVIDDGQLSF